MKRDLFEEEHEQFRQSFRAWLEGEVVPYADKWERDGIVPRDLYRRAGDHGFLGFEVPEEYGGAGVRDFRYNLVVAEEITDAGVFAATVGICLHNDVTLPYLLRYCSAEQKKRWLPGVVSGELITAIAMTEPSMGSDLAGMRSTAVRDGDDYILNGSKTFITNGINSHLVIVAAKTAPEERHSGITLLVVEEGMAGFERGRNLEKVGLHAQDTAELFFTDVRVPAANRLGEEGNGFYQLVANLPQERLSLAAGGLAYARAALNWTIAYCHEREAFGQPIGTFQNSRFALAEMRTEVEIGMTFVDRCVLALNEGTLSPEDAAMAKWWCTELQNRVVDRCVQLHGGYGFMIEYPIARAYSDSRVTTIYGGTTEIMKEIIGRSMGF
ncbi:MAG: Acyl-CoA dehydrogenase [Acidimicrobiales bacterium]|nr:Acyl-CoA dehydrogenase [Acidimicrobiales bacterium]